MTLPIPETLSKDDQRSLARCGIRALICAQCGSTTLALRSDARYCSNACRQAAYRARRRRPISFV